ncbi:sigma-70 family RNA polymerase sigma factor [Arthrobacter sp. SDTb3-6]|uniref:sigma-70 family RNA polymerase sigma factor n=1 Tax=Arthrobacter sp. SDTb3-6 TaxID=2713571 RepID=UPI00159E1E71|nr:sigma-70 family RNA polymerase sigma factor [Arthrobacter sp. SDTb3-6]NVM98040.1 sigma-70 family RNA polymerase sigma factor [Arthrobacter sp. SDTb3-6]
MDQQARTGTPTREEAMRALHRDYAVQLTRFVQRLTSEGTVAQDVVAETLLRAWEHPDVLQRTEPALRGWLFTVARNLVIDDWRSARHRREIGTDQLPEHPGPDQTDRILDAWLVEDALLTLTPEHREVIRLAYFDGKDTRSIGAALGVPDGTVKSRLHYGLRALRLALEERGVSSR